MTKTQLIDAIIHQYYKTILTMDFYDEEYEKSFKPSYSYFDERTKVLVDLSLVALAIALIIEIIKAAF